MIELLYAKIHRATVSDTNVDYEGSITISKNLIQAAGIFEYEKVTVVDVNNGNRFDTYVIITDIPNVICVNGAAAHLVQKGDKVIIMCYRSFDLEKSDRHLPIVIKVDLNNQIQG